MCHPSGPLERTRRRWEDDIKMDLQKFGWGGGAWSGLMCLRIGPDGGICESNNKLPVP
jgi:hypothetical protein